MISKLKSPYNNIYNIKDKIYNNNQALINNDIYNNTLLVHNAITGIIFASTPKKKGELSCYHQERQERSAVRIAECILGQGLVSTQLYIELDTITGKPLSIRDYEVCCNSRLCPYCSERNRKRNHFKIYEEISQYKHPRFLTFGFKAVSNLTRHYVKEISKLHNAFIKELHTKRKWHKKFQLGRYCSVMEVKRHHKGDLKKDGGVYEQDQWYVHFHVIFDGEYLPNNAHNEYLITRILQKATKNATTIGVNT